MIARRLEPCAKLPATASRSALADGPLDCPSAEVEVLRHLARGCSEKKIGELLFISPGTVHTHVAHVYEKIGVSTRAAAALFAMEHDLLVE